MKICAFSDMHGDLGLDIPQADLYLIAGDICPVWDHTVKGQLNWLHNEFRALLKRLDEKKVLWVAGNHDLILQKNPAIVDKSIMGGYLFDSMVEFKGLKIYGTPWQPIFGKWAFNLTEEELAHKWSMIPDDIDILVSHSPPYGYVDKVIHETDKYGMPLQDGPFIRHCGSKSLKKRILEIKPKLVVCGHIHCDAGITYLEDTIIANCSILDDDYKIKNKPKLFEIKEGVTTILSV
jgi:Icc-related predicted phosphoesterase